MRCGCLYDEQRRKLIVNLNYEQLDLCVVVIKHQGCFILSADASRYNGLWKDFENCMQDPRSFDYNSDKY